MKANKTLGRLFSCTFLAAFVVLYYIPGASAAVIFQDDFEGSIPNLGSGNRVAPNHADANNGTIYGSGDYFVRTDDPGDGTTNGFTATFTNIQGSFYWRGEDLDGAGTNPDVINWTGIDITGMTNLTFTGFFGARDTSPFESGDSIVVEANMGSGFLSLLAFQAAAPTNAALREDANNTGVGDGTLLGLALQSFSANIPGTGTTLDLRITASANGGSEEFAFDHFTVSGVPEPTTLALLAVGLPLLQRRRKR